MSNEVVLQAEPVVPAVIKTNISAVKDYVSQAMTKYQSYIIDETNLKQAETDYKQLNKVAKQIDDERKNITRVLDNQKKDIKCEFDEVINLINQVTTPMKQQFDEFEIQRKETRKNEVNELIKPLFDGLDMKFIAKFVFDEKWLNKTKKDNEIVSEAELKIEVLLKEQEAYNNDIQAINTLVSQKNTELDIKLDLQKFLDQYELIGNFTTVLNDINSNANFNKKQYEELQQKAVANAEQEMQKNQTVSEPLSEVEVPILPNAAVNEPIWSCTFTATGPFSKLKALKQFIEDNEIDLKVIEQVEVK